MNQGRTAHPEYLMTSGSNPLLQVDALYCISLPERNERWEQAQREFDLIGIRERVIRFPAIKRPNPIDGCRLSHLSIIREAEANNYEAILVFEDDVHFMTHRLEPLAAAMDSLRDRKRWDMLYLGGRVVSPVTVVNDHLFRAQFWSTHAYMMHRDAYRRAMQATGAIDVWYSRNMRRCYGVNPMMATQNEGYSDIEGRHISYKTDAFLKSYEGSKKRKYRGEYLSVCYAVFDAVAGGVRRLAGRMLS